MDLDPCLRQAPALSLGAIWGSALTAFRLPRPSRLVVSAVLGAVNALRTLR